MLCREILVGTGLCWGQELTKIQTLLSIWWGSPAGLYTRVWHGKNSVSSYAMNKGILGFI